MSRDTKKHPHNPFNPPFCINFNKKHALNDKKESLNARDIQH